MRFPRSLGAYGMAAVLTIFGGGFVRACSTSATTPTNDVMKVAQTCTSLVNKERTSRGLKALAIDSRIQNAAQKHSNYQAKAGQMTHHEPAPRYSAGDRMGAEGYRWSWWGENVAAGQISCSQVMSAWMASAGHRANILSKNFVHIGVAAAKGGNGVVYWTMDLGAP